MANLSYLEFRELMRKCGEYTNIMLRGLYVRYLAGDAAPCVAQALCITQKTQPATTTTRTVRKLPDEVLVARKERRHEHAVARQQSILMMLDTQPMDAYQIGVGMGVAPDYAMKFLRQLEAQKLILVTKIRQGRALKNLYSLAEQEGDEQ